MSIYTIYINSEIGGLSVVAVGEGERIVSRRGHERALWVSADVLFHDCLKFVLTL